jgi:hypothetical protein
MSFFKCVQNLQTYVYLKWVIISRKMRWAGHVKRKRERRGVYRVLVRKREGKRPLGRTRHCWEYNIKNGSSGSAMWGYGLD